MHALSVYAATHTTVHTCVHLFFAAVEATSSCLVGVTPARLLFTLQQGPSPMWGGAQSMQLVSTKGTMGASGPYLRACVQEDKNFLTQVSCSVQILGYERASVKSKASTLMVKMLLCVCVCAFV